MGRTGQDAEGDLVHTHNIVPDNNDTRYIYPYRIAIRFIKH